MSNRGLATSAGLTLLALGAAACPRATPAAPPAPSERDLLLDKIRTLDEVAPCLPDAGPSSVHLVDAELAGEAATATFACANGAASGKVTFFRIAGTWIISTKEIKKPPRAP